MPSPPIKKWNVNPAGLGTAWKAAGTGNCMGFVLSAFRQYGTLINREIDTASNTVDTIKGMGIKTSVFRHLSCVCILCSLALPKGCPTGLEGSGHS